MSFSQAALSTTDNKSDEVMMEAPDSPPEQTISPRQSVSGSSSNQQPNAAAFRTNGEGSGKPNHGAPGSSWNTKKFHDEFERASSQLNDSNWDHTKYGDTLLEQLQQQK